MKSIIYAFPEGQTRSRLPMDLIQAYYAAHFFVFGDRKLILRIATVEPNLSKLHTYGYVTAYNPEGEQLSDKSDELNHIFLPVVQLNSIFFSFASFHTPLR